MTTTIITVMGKKSPHLEFLRKTLFQKFVLKNQESYRKLQQRGALGRMKQLILKQSNKSYEKRNECSSKAPSLL